MKIGINASFARKENTGIGQVTQNFLKKLTRLKSESDKLNISFILYLEEDLPKDFRLPENFEIRVFLPLWKRDDLIRKIWWEKFLLPKKVKMDGCDVFFSLYQSTTVLPEKTKHLMLVHDIIPKLFPEYLNNFRKKFYWKLTESAIRKADKIISVSKRTEKDLIQHLAIAGEKITVSHVDVDKIYKSPVSEAKVSQVMHKYSLQPGYIYSGGGLEVRKNTEGVIRAYKYLLEKNKNHQFVQNFPKLVISGKLLPQLAPLIVDAEQLVKELNLTPFVQLLDFVPQEDVPALYANASLFIYPSFYEGFGLPILESMSVGTPTIAAKTSSLPEIGSDAVLYCDPESTEDIAMTMRNVLISRDLRQSLSQRGKERSQNFSWENFVLKFFNIAKNLN